jgi:glucose-6-phosphate isomerase
MVWTQQQESQLVDIAKSHDLPIYYESSIECGRYGIFADHNLLLMCLMQVDHIAILNGMRHAMQHHSSFLFDSDKPIAVYAGYGSCFEPLLQWLCQIISESLGKQGAGITPMFSIAPQDHHTMMQLYLDGPADKSFTMLHIKSATPSLLDSLLETMFHQAVQALRSRQLPVRVQEIEQWNAWSLGYFIMLNTLEVLHFAKKRGISAWTQPAVQEMKQRVYTCAKVV